MNLIQLVVRSFASPKGASKMLRATGHAACAHGINHTNVHTNHTIILLLPACAHTAIARRAEHSLNQVLTHAVFLGTSGSC